MKFQNGHAKVGGRKKGTPNKNTIEVKAALQEVFDKMGSIAAFFKWSKKNPDLFYAMWLKMLPQEVKAEVNSTGQLALKWVVKNAENGNGSSGNRVAREAT